MSTLDVVVTLVHAVGELRRSQLLTSSDIETVLYDRMLEMDRLVVETDGFAEVLARACDDSESLSRVDTLRFLAYEHIFYDAREAAVEASSSNLMDEATFDPGMTTSRPMRHEGRSWPGPGTCGTTTATSSSTSSRVWTGPR